MKKTRKRAIGGSVFNGSETMAPKKMKGAERHGIGQKLESRADGGAENTSKEVRAHGGSVKKRLDRPGRKLGGRCGSDMAPLSSAGKGDHEYKRGGAVHEKKEEEKRRGGKVEKKEKKDDEEDRARGGGTHWIQGAIKHPGALHRELGVPEGEKIPAKKIAKAAHSSNPLLAKRARFAETLKSLH